jgi:hypothetical protein
MSNRRIVMFFYVASFLGIVAVSALLALVYRDVAIQDLVKIRKDDNIRFTQSALAFLKPSLADFLEDAKSSKPGTQGSSQSADPIRAKIRDLLVDPNVLRVKIFGPEGAVLFSTLADQIGNNQAANEGFVSAMHGTAITELVYRDSFNAFDRVTEEDNLMHTYVPVRREASSPVLGVFEIYTDMNPLVHAIEHTTFKLMAGGLLVLLTLYFGLVFMVHYGRRIIEAQQHTIRERSTTLELLTSQILTSHETEKRKLADDLHEGVAQTLAAIKLSVEAVLRSATDSDQPQYLHQAVHAIQVAIQEVRGIAMDLHPPVLDDFGLNAALEWVCGEFEALRPDVLAARHLQMDEDEIPPPLVTIIYRIAADSFKAFAMNKNATRVSVGLRKNADVIILVMDETSDGEVEMHDDDSDRTEAILAKIRQHTLLSGGALTITTNASGGRKLQAEWMV